VFRNNGEAFFLVLRFQFYETASTIQTWWCPKSFATCPICSYTPLPLKINPGSAPGRSAILYTWCIFVWFPVVLRLRRLLSTVSHPWLPPYVSLLLSWELPARSFQFSYMSTVRPMGIGLLGSSPGASIGAQEPLFGRKKKSQVYIRS
jgi:hypothetical protein